ncbi:5-hydroxytryptamine receptor 3A-like [Cyclopterus lumpus]|uniref:5-hydroxytryptamine receptor 3A-like n=1 Tax=Cyclopterus lumpus TaxID=8103 RepID=UPI001487045B|nr:5-hydroxytryptamine receptor 3A-like [Cyclopterus lumpus]
MAAHQLCRSQVKMLAGFFFLLLVTDAVTYNSSEDPRRQHKDYRDNARDRNHSNDNNNNNCSHRDVYKYLNMTEGNAKTAIRPGSDSSPTEVILDVLLFSILDVNEKEQQFISYLWVDSWWDDPDLSWNSEDFCYIYTIYPPTNALWKPDVSIEEMTQKNKALSSPYLKLYSSGQVFFRTYMVVVTNCPMEVYMFPFDVQECNLTFKSTIHTSQHLELTVFGDSSWNTELSLENMAQSEWLFIDMVNEHHIVNNFYLQQSVMVYTITMKRRSALYIANFLLPILFFLCLDLASFLIPDNGGEKLSFKVTVLLAVTVMQLILNEILPSSSDRIPLIAIYCIGIFGLMMLSLLETILMMYLLERDSASRDNEANEEQRKADCCTKLKKWISCAGVCNVSVDETPPEQLSVTTEANSSQPTEESNALEKISDELKELEKTLTQVLNCREKERKPGYWTRVAKIINIVFFFFYVIAAITLLTGLFLLWNTGK